MAASSFSLLALLSLLVQLTSAAQWTIIQYNIEVITTSTGVYNTYTGTQTYRLYPPVSPTPTASATSRVTSTDTLYDATYTTLYIPGSAIPATQLASLRASSTTTRQRLTIFYMDVVYTPPASCSSQFTFTTSSLVNVPVGAETNVSPTSLTTSRSSTYQVVTGYLTAGAVTPTTTSTRDFVQSYYIDRCSSPGSGSRTRSGSSSPTSSRYSGGGSYFSGDYYSYENCLGSLCPFWLIYIVVIIPVVAFLFLGGLIESYYWFTRLMKGQSALRGVPLMWVAISIWTLCCLRRHRSASPEQQPQLLKQWREMSTGTHIKLWLKYGFRHRDPPQLAAIIGQQSSVPVWQTYANPSYAPPSQQPPPPGAPGGPGMQQQPGQPPMQEAPAYSQQPQTWQGAYAWSSAPPSSNFPPPGSPPPQGYPSQPGSPPPQGYVYPPQSYVYPSQEYVYSSQDYVYPPPPQQQGMKANQGSFALGTMTPPSHSQQDTPSPVAATGGAVGGVGGATAAPPSPLYEGEHEHGVPQQVGTERNGADNGHGGDSAPEVLVQQPKSDMHH